MPSERIASGPSDAATGSRLDETPETDSFYRTFADGQAIPTQEEWLDRLKRYERGKRQAELLNISFHMRIRQLESAIRKMDSAHTILPENARHLAAAEDGLNPT